MKLIVNALVDPRIVMTPNVGNDRAWVWSCFDYSEAKLEEEVFSIKFANAEVQHQWKQNKKQETKTHPTANRITASTRMCVDQSAYFDIFPAFTDAGCR